MLLDRGAIVSSQAMACLDDTKLKDTEHKAYAQRPPGQRPVIYKRLNDALRQLKLAGVGSCRFLCVVYGRAVATLVARH